jgi:hypothetical protein
MAADCSSVEYEPSHTPRTEMLFGGAKKGIETLVAEVKALGAEIVDRRKRPCAWFSPSPAPGAAQGNLRRVIRET